MPLTEKILRTFVNPVFVETGTYIGESSDLAISVGFKEVHTIDIDPASRMICLEKWAGMENMHAYTGSSDVILPRILGCISGRITFWLDAHPWDATLDFGKAPLLGELKAIRVYCDMAVSEMYPTVLIDDIRVFSKDDVAMLMELCQNLYSGCNVFRMDDDYAKGDILCVTP